VLFADLSDSTRLYQTQGDVRAHQQVSQSLQCMKSEIERHSGSLLRTVGDAALASFNSSDDACEAAIAIQRAHHNLGLTARVGFHFGEVIADSGDIYGNAVNVAARIAAFAEAKEICTSDSVIAKLSHRHRVNTRFLDRVRFKGVSTEVSVYRVNWQTDSAQTAIVSPDAVTQAIEHERSLELFIENRCVRVDAEHPLCTIGRASESDVVIESESASRNHASVELNRGRFVLNDFSTNGTYLINDEAGTTLIRRESVILDNQGSIGLGFDPNLETANAIKYKVIRVKH
jgi:hypothetical protein